MNKIVRKLRPSNYWRIGEHESWFADMAAEGFHLKKMGVHFAQFVADEPKNTRYRIDVSINKKITPEQFQMYAESGWDYVTSYSYFHVFSSPESSAAPELHTDPAEQSYTLKELDKRLAMNASIVVISMLLMIGMLLAIWFLDGTPTLVLVEGMAIQQTISTLFIGYLAFTSLQAALSIRALRKKLVDGKPIDHHAPWKKYTLLNASIAIVFTVIVGFSAALPFIQLVKADTKTLPEESLDLPIVRLADIEQNPALIREEPYYLSDNVDWTNRYSYDWSLFAPVQYETDENGVIPSRMWEDGSGVYSPSLHSRVFKLSVPALADELITDLIKRYSLIERIGDYVETNHSELDLLIVHEEKDFKEIFASKGNAVIYIRYYGYANLGQVIDRAVEVINRVSE